MRREDTTRARFRRFVLTSSVTLITGHLLLFWIHSILDVAPVPANLASTTANTVIVFMVSRRWVWRVDRSVEFQREVVPFMFMAAIGMTVSTVLVWLTARHIGDGLWVNAANLTGFGLVWIARFVVLDTYIYGREPANYPATSRTK